MTKLLLLIVLALTLSGCSVSYKLKCVEGGKVVYDGIIDTHFILPSRDSKTGEAVSPGDNATCFWKRL